MLLFPLSSASETYLVSCLFLPDFPWVEKLVFSGCLRSFLKTEAFLKADACF